MKTTIQFMFALAIIIGFHAAASAQRQTKLYIDDGHGAFSTLSAPLGGGAITLPGSSITFPTGNALGVLSNDGSGNLFWAATSGFTPAFISSSASSNLLVISNGSSVNMNAFLSGFTADGGGLFTANTTGYYKIDWSIEANTNATLLNKFALEQNGVPQVNFDVINATTVSGTSILALTAGDIIGIYNVSGGTVTLEGSTNAILPAHMTVTRIQ